MINWKIPVGFASFGAVVSLLAGIIGGNPFGVILLRLILSAGICGGLGLAVNLIVKKYLPELSANQPIPQTESGEEVDIVIDEDIPLAEEAEEIQVPKAPDSGEVGEPTVVAEVTDEDQSQIGNVEEIDESEENVLTLEDADSAVEFAPVEATPEEPAPTETLSEEFVPGIAAEQVTDFEDLDTLPDIDQFTPAAEESTPPSKPSRTNTQVDEVVRDQDPENLARAVRTFMKKDQ